MTRRDLMGLTNPALLDHARRAVDVCPVLALQKSQEAPLAKVGDAFRAGPRELLLQLSEGAAPMRVVFAASVDAMAQEQAVAKLLEAGYHMDLAEPLERVTAALQSLVVQES